MLNARRWQLGNSFIGLCIGVVLIGTALAVWLNRQYIVDWLSFVQYTPTADVAKISERTTLSDKGKFYFYSSHPSIEPADTFNKVCTRREASTAILGCYTNNRVYVYDVTDARLDGIKEVTAAHEMLHAVYQRLGHDERTHTDALLEQEYKKLAGDKSLTERMAYYDKNEPGEKYNELHSIIATEYSDIGNDLEGYYAAYFRNRKEIVKLHSGYADVFTKLATQATTLSKQLTSLGEEIERESAEYNAAVKVLNADVKAFNTRAQGGDFDSQTVFNRERSVLVARADALDATRQKVNTDMETYEKLRTEYNQTASTSNELYKSMDSKLAPAPSI